MKIQKVSNSTYLDTREMAKDLFLLLKPLYCHVLIDEEWYECIIPEGFITDYCSVPRVPLAYTLFGGKYNRTGTFHDALYSDWKEIKIVHAASREELPITKELADGILYKSLVDEGAWSTTAYSMWLGVHTFGSMFYKRLDKK